MSSTVTFCCVKVHFQTQGKNYHLFSLLLPHRPANRWDSILRVIEWLRHLRRWFDQPDGLLHRLGEFLSQLPFSAFRELQTIDMTSLEEVNLSTTDCNNYGLLIESGGDELILSRDISSEEFSTKMAMFLMQS